MKKKLFAVAAALGLVFAVVLALVGCTNNKVYYTEGELPEHVTDVSVALSDNAMYNDSKGDYVFKDSDVKFTVYLESGYKLASFKLFANGEEIPLVKENQDVSSSSYVGKTTYHVGDTLNVTYEGKPEVIIYKARLSVTNFGSEYPESEEQVYLQVNGREEGTIAEFKRKSPSERIFNNLKATEPFQVFVYTNGYDKVAFNSNTTLAHWKWEGDESQYGYILGDFVIEEGKYGIKYYKTIFEDSEVSFSFKAEEGIVCDFRDNGEQMTQIIVEDNEVFDVKINGRTVDLRYDSTYFKFSDFDQNGEAEFAIVFKESVGTKINTILNGLEFKMFCSDTVIPYTVDGNTITMKLKRPYEYAAFPESPDNMDPDYAYRYLLLSNLLERTGAAGLTLKTPEIV